MNKFCGILLFAMMLGNAFSPMKAVAGSENEQLLLQKAQELLNNFKDSEALQLYEEVLLSLPKNYEALCKASFLHSRIGDRFEDETRKIEHFERAKDFAMLAYGLNPEDAESNYIMAISVGNMAMVSGPRRRLEGINQAKIFIDQALQSDASHAGAWHLLGRWHFKMANLNLAEIAAARILFGGVGNEASNYKAIEALQQAIKYDAENIRYYFDLATIYKELNEKQACVSILEKALALDVATSEDLETARRCKMMLHKQVK